ncbi:MAG: sulfatase [Pirellulales bacterium]
MFFRFVVFIAVWIWMLGPRETRSVCCAFDNARPNVLLILVDDLKPALGCYGDRAAKTPQIDRFAERSMRFERAYCNQAVCAPSRFTLMLGSHSTSSGLYFLNSRLRDHIPDAVTLPQHFQAHGYRTESLGKVFHIGHGNHGDPDSFSIPHTGDKVIEYLLPESTDGGRLTREEALFSNQQLDRIASLPRGAAYEAPEVDDDAYADGRIAIEAVKRLRDASLRRETDGTPFFIAVGFARPHLPFSVPAAYWRTIDSHQLEIASEQELPEKSPKVAGKRGGEIAAYAPVPEGPNAKFSEELQRQLLTGYYASVSYVDAQIGKVLDEVFASGLDRNTIIVLWSDHGYHLGDHGIWTKHTNYEQAVRIPLFIRAPEVTRDGSVTGQLTESVDLFPTLSDLAGLPRPTVPQPMDGRSLVPVLKDPQERVRNHAFHAYPKEKLGRAIRTERFRLVEWKNPSALESEIEWELYDYESDPGEKVNLADQRPEVLRELKAILDSYPAPIQPGAKPAITRK